MKSRAFREIWMIVLWVVCTPGHSWAEERVSHDGRGLTVGSLFASGMVLQCDKPVTVWGTSEPSCEVKISFAGYDACTETDVNGQWRVVLPAMKASSEGRRMEIVSGKQKIVLEDILVGEVWLAGGQSNMAMSVRALTPGDKTELMSFSDSLVRYYQVMPIVGGGKVRSRPDVVWSRPDSTKMGTWSALSLYFARQLREALQVPVGIVCVAQGSSSGEAWISREYTAEHPELKESFAPAFPPEKIASYYKNPHVLYERMLARVIGCPIRGFVWYQGESNADRAEYYPVVFRGVIDCWREAWGDRNLPFLFVQLPSFDKKERRTEPSWALIREAQADVARSVPYTAMAVTVDVGDPANLHPKDKKTVGYRLALVARRTVYGDRRVAVSPVYETVRFKGGRAFVRFDSGGAPLVKKDTLKEFELCGADGIWRPAKAELKGDVVEVWSDRILRPVAVRYAWRNATTVSLYNKAGMPVSPFRSDCK